MITIKGKYSEAVVFTDEITLDSGATAQLFDLLNSKMVKGEEVRIMPDYHVGKNCMVGYTQTYTYPGPVNPDILGVDLGCGVRSVRFKLTSMSKSIIDNPVLTDMKIRKVIPTGLEINDKTVIDEKDFRRFLKGRLERARSLWPEAIKFNGLGEIDKLINSTLKRIGQDPAVFWKSLGTLGSGNHFLEVGYEDGVQDSIWITVHTGSRNLGIKIHSYWKRLTSKKRIISKEALKNEEKRIRQTYSGERIKEEIKKLESNEKFFNLPGNLLLSEEEISGYLEDMIFAQAYAEYNRMTIILRIKGELKLGKELDVIESIHNYVDPSDKIFRKGSIKSLQGELMVIPMNMSFGTLVCKGKGNKDWNFSAPHGAGRVLSRIEAKSLISLEDFKNSMGDVFSTSIVKECIDESPLAYKDPMKIIPLLSDTVDILYTVKPLISIKGI